MKMLHIIDVDVDDVIYIPTNEGFVGGRVKQKDYNRDQQKYFITMNGIPTTFVIRSDNFVIYDNI